MRVEVHMQEQSEPVTYTDVRNAYTKGPMYCVMGNDGVVRKHPVMGIFRVVESPEQTGLLEA